MSSDIRILQKMENINEPQPAVPEVTEPTSQKAETDQVQPPIEEPITSGHAKAEELPTSTFSIQDLVHHDPEPESGESTFVSYTGYRKKQTQPLKFVGNEGTILEREGDPSQRSNQEETTQADEGNIIFGSDEPPQESQGQETVVAGEGQKGEAEKSIQREQETVPLTKNDTL